MVKTKRDRRGGKKMFFLKKTNKQNQSKQKKKNYLGTKIAVYQYMLQNMWPPINKVMSNQS